MTWEDDFLQHMMKGIDSPGNASAIVEGFTVKMTREQLTELKSWLESGFPVDPSKILRIPEEIDEPE